MEISYAPFDRLRVTVAGVIANKLLLTYSVTTVTLSLSKGV